MKQSIVLIALTLFVSTNAVQAQDEMPAAPKEKVFNHNVGVQMNELIRQVFNFNGNNNNVNNPYLLIYSLNWKKSGIGIRLGAGPNFNKFSENDGITERDNDIKTINVRLGVEKAFQLSNKWSAGVGVDGLFNTQDNKTITSTRGFDTTITNVTSTLMSYGGGAMGWLRYHVTQHVVIGTEASFYYTTGEEKQKVTITQRLQNNPGPFGPAPITTTSTNLTNKINRGVFSMPVVFYLIVKF